MSSQRDHAGAGKGRHVNDRVRLEAAAVMQGIGKQQPALRIGIDDLDGFAAGRGQHITGTVG